MTYLVQKTNMFKQKMKIDDKITGSKMHTEQIWDSCTWFPRVGLTLTEFMIHYLHRLVKLFLVNLQSPVSGIIKVLNKRLEGCSINDRPAFGGAQLNATHARDSSPRVGLPRPPDIQVAGPCSFHFSAFGFAVTACLPVSLTPACSIQRPRGHFLSERTPSMIRLWLFYERWPPHTCPRVHIRAPGRRKRGWLGLSLGYTPYTCITSSGCYTLAFGFTNHQCWWEVGGRGRWMCGPWGWWRLQGCYFHIKM